MTVGNPCRVMIVDDEVLIRQGIKHYFNWEEEGFLIVGEAGNGREALELIEEVKPHILLTDIVMPVMDGEELTKVVKANYPHIEIIVLSSFGEFEYVRSSFQSGVVDYILKPKLDAQSLLEVLRTAVKRMPDIYLSENHIEVTHSVDQLIDKLLSGYEVDSLEEAEAFFPHPAFFLLGADIKQTPGMQAEVKEQVRRVFAEKIDHAVCHPVKTDKEMLVFLLNIADRRYDEVVTVLKACSRHQPGCGFVLTSPFSDFANLGEVYRNRFLQLKQYRFYFPDKELVLQEDMSAAPGQPLHFHLEWLTEELKCGRFDTAFQYICEHGKKLSACCTAGVHEFKSLFNNIIFNVTILLRNIGYDVKELEIHQYRQMSLIEEAGSAQQVVSRLEAFIAEAKQCILQQQPAVDNPNMKMLLAYIDEHYMEPLTLTEVARHFHFHPSYLSSYFSNHNKEGFSEYLNKLRITAAIRQLNTSAAPISEISAQVGYSDHSYFCKVFKKATGCSPSQYRRKRLK
ncbi:two-component system, response regulator YesN [Evansella caseinilytica]|uniref:Two-component system, response regulator YesN n=1 Tax=Evansella caseinilytica TaxID=1503961 RepID=A0A1H3T5V3_9BACI|nr:response regulator transcription factor [Evansella caseinilytica]SDZ45297.1 two-component system, response regulator YesN [Evansella caseinilytica]